MSISQIVNIVERHQRSEKKLDDLFKASEKAHEKANEFEDAYADLLETRCEQVEEHLKRLVERKIKLINSRTEVPTKRGEVYSTAVIMSQGCADAAYQLLAGSERPGRLRRITLNTAISRSYTTIWKIVGSSRSYRSKSDAKNRINPIRVL